DQFGDAEVDGLDAYRAGEDSPAALDQPVGQRLDRLRVRHLDRRGVTGHGEVHAVLGQPHDDLLALAERLDTHQVADEHRLRVIGPVGLSDHDLVIDGHLSSLLDDGPAPVPMSTVRTKPAVVVGRSPDKRRRTPAEQPFYAPYMGTDRADDLRLADLVAAFSIGCDLRLGQPMEHVLRSWRITARMGERMGFDYRQ